MFMYFIMAIFSTFLFLIIETYRCISGGDISDNKKILKSGVIAFTPMIIFVVYSEITRPNIERQFVQYEYGEFVRVENIGSGRHPKMDVLTTKTTLNEVSPDYFGYAKPGDSLKFKAVVEGHEINTYYCVANSCKAYSSCEFNMTCWDDSMERYGFKEEG